MPDATEPDASNSDATSPDATASQEGGASGLADATPLGNGGGCGCTTAGGAGPTGADLARGIALVLAGARRRRAAKRERDDRPA